MKPFIYFIGLFLVLTFSYGLYEGKVGRIDASAALKLSYDSLVFGMPSNEFDAVKKSNSSLINKGLNIFKLPISFLIFIILIG